VPLTDAPECVKRLDLEGRLLEINAGGLAMIEAGSFEEVAGCRVIGLVLPAHRDAFRALLARAVGGEHGTLRFEIASLRGARRWVSGLMVPLRDSGGRVHEILVVTRDITRQRRAEARGTHERSMLELLARGAPLPDVLGVLARGYGDRDEGTFASILLVDPSGRRLVLGAAPDLPPAYADALEGIEIGAAGGCCGAAAAAGALVVTRDIAADPSSEHAGHVAVENGIRACWSVPFRSTEGQILGTFAFCCAEARPPRDDEVSALERGASFAGLAVERERTLQALRDNEAYHRRVSELLSEYAYAFRVEADGTLTREWVAGAFWRISGFTPEELERDGGLWRLIHPDDMPAALERGARLRAGQSDISEYRIVTRAGEVRWLRDHAYPEWSEAEQRVLRIFGAAEDVTERRQIREQFVQAQKMESVGRLAGGVAHDFNNILTIISGTAELALQRPVEGEVRGDFETIRAAAERAAGLTRQLLAFSRRQRFLPEVVDLNERLAGIVPMLRRLAGREIRLELDGGSALHRVQIDPAQFDQVMMNLAANARDAMPRGGTLTIRTENADPRTDEAEGDSAPAGGPGVRLSVTDTGEGMDEATSRQVFEPFFTTKPVGQGTGLGLSMVYGTIKQSGGHIWVESRVGEGTTFRIELPAAEATAPLPPTGAGEAPAGGAETILVVEDEHAVRQLTCRILESAGYRVLAAPHASEALRLLEAHGATIRLMLTDVVMPDVSGIELATEVAERFPHTKLLFMSGHAESRTGGTALPGLDIPFIAKPFDIPVLTSHVRNALAAIPAGSA
jgi:PAS domain S-box-containing protein